MRQKTPKRTRINGVAVIDVRHLTDLLLVIRIVELNVDDREIEQIVTVVLNNVRELLRIALGQTNSERRCESKYSSWLRRSIVEPTVMPVHLN